MTPSEIESLSKFVADSVRADLDRATAPPVQLTFFIAAADATPTQMAEVRKMNQNPTAYVVCERCSTFYHRDHPELHAKTCRGTR